MDDLPNLLDCLPYRKSGWTMSYMSNLQNESKKYLEKSNEIMKIMKLMISRIFSL